MGIAAFGQGALWRGEPDRWPLWLPVALGCGAGAYLALGGEPGLWSGWAGLGAGLVLALGAALWRPGRVMLALLAALALGFGLARLRTDRVATPVLDHALTAHLTARVVSLEPRPRGVRYVLADVRSGALGETPPLRIRVSQRASGTIFQPGDWISLTARLDSPPAPVSPGAGDFGRSLYFQSIGATGFVYGRARGIVPARALTPQERIGVAVEKLRTAMTARIQNAIPGSRGGIASSLVTGTRGGLSEDDEAALRDAGLAHVLAISGLQMAMVGGGLFWLIRAVLAAVPALVLRYPIKKWAAGAALVATLFYLVISGAAPSAARAFVMFAFVMLAIIADRPALTMRSMAFAAGLLLLARPESVADPGFQMSFAAVAGLVAVAEWEQRRMRTPRGLLHGYVHVIVMTSLIGSLATLPFSLFHFGRAAHYAILGNLVAMPVMGFWIMPAAALAVLLMPFGLEGFALTLLGQGIGVMVSIGRWVSGLPGAVSLAPAMPMAALVAFSLGGLWLAIRRTPLRWMGLLPVLLGAWLTLTAKGPDMLVAADARTVAVRGEDGLLHFLRKPADKFAAREWLRRDGDGRDIGAATGMKEARCDGYGCVIRRGGVLVASALKPEALEEDCVRAQILVSAVAATCRTPVVVIDAVRAAAGAGWQVTFSPTAKAVSVRQRRGERPWVPQIQDKDQ